MLCTNPHTRLGVAHFPSFPIKLRGILMRFLRTEKRKSKKRRLGLGLTLILTRLLTRFPRFPTFPPTEKTKIALEGG